jgi:succinoglycan biosynthesis protein ExoM
MLISICVATYQRPEGLKRLLDGIDRLIFTRCDTPQIEVIVVDNDPTCSAQTFCQQLRSSFQWELKYFSEPQRGISYVRNQAVAQVSPSADFVAFIDDDEVPEPSWLEELLTIQQIYAADVVAGPSPPFFPDPDVPQWVIKGKFFEPLRYPTGHLLKFTSTNNVLVKAQILREIQPIFDERFALTGGEDTHLFMRVYRAGYKLVWADAAIVYEWIPKSRTNAKWILQRGYRCHSTYGLCEKELEPALIKVLARRISTGTGRITIGLISLLPAIVIGKHLLIQSLLQISRGAGMLSGLLGRSYEEYRSTHGD